MQQRPAGILVLNKPTGMTSRTAVNIVQRLCKPLKAGHAGTLDPLADGVLVTCVGTATRLIEYVQRMRKIYHATFLLGRTSETEDVEGTVELLDEPPIPAEAAIRDALPAFIGRIEQRPPAFSALKVNGQRAYDLARQGKNVDLAPRTIEIHGIELLRYDYPVLQLRIECGSGTYVRSIGRDLAESLGTGAVMSALTRTAIGHFDIHDAIHPDALDKEKWQEHLRPMIEALALLPKIVVDDDDLQRLRHGQQIRRPTDAQEASEWAAVDLNGRLAAILVPRDEGMLHPRRGFAH